MRTDRHLLLARPLPGPPGRWLAVDLRGGVRTWHLDDPDHLPADAPGAVMVAGPGAVCRALPGGGLRLGEGVLWGLADPLGAARDPVPLPVEESAAAAALRHERGRWRDACARWQARPATDRARVRGLLRGHRPDPTLLLDLLDLPLPAPAGRDAAEEAPPVLRPAPPPPPVDPDALGAWVAAADGLGRLFGPGFTPRAEQAAMARAVAAALTGGRAALVEAETGVGKTLAYLAPLVAHGLAGERSVVATHTRALQVQILEQDLPRLAPVLGGLKAALLMGRRNYLCLRQRRAYLTRPRADLADALRGAAFVLWLADTRSGLREEVADHPLLAPDAGELFDAPEPCLPGACYEEEGCWVQHARRRAREADLLVVNHALLMLDLAQDGALLGDHAHLVVDEAHRLPAVALDTHAVVCGLRRGEEIEQLLGVPGAEGLPERVALAAARLAPPDGDEAAAGAAADFGRAVSAGVRAYIAWWQALGRHVDAALPAGGRPRGRQRVRDKDAAFAPLRAEAAALLDALGAADEAFARLAAAAGAVAEPGPALQDDLAVLGQAGQLVRTLHQDVRFLLTGPEEDWVTWLEPAPVRGARLLGATRLEAGALLRRYWQDRERAPVMTSATLAVGEDFGHMLGELGLDRRRPPTRTEAVPTPFDLRRQVRALVPARFPQPDAPDFDRSVGEVVRDLALDTGRKTMALFTSYRALGVAAEVLAEAGLDEQGSEGPALLVQREGGAPGALARRFRRRGRAVLLGTATFWEGVDFPGEDLEILVVTRLPFRVPNDPWVDARCERLQAAGENPFTAFMVRDAVLRLRQGCGRLIRRAEDRGVIVVLDPRLHTRSYGATFLGALPVLPATFGDTADLLARVQEFLAPRPNPGAVP